MTRDKANTALLVPARAMQGANDVNRPVGRSVRSLDQVGMHGVGAGNGVKAGNGPHFGLHTCLAQTGQVAVTQPVASKALPMWKPSTGEPYAGKPPVRFGGRGGRKSFPTPIQAARRQHVAQEIHLLLGVALGVFTPLPNPAPWLEALRGCR